MESAINRSIHISGLIETICSGSTAGDFDLEISLLTFCAWLHRPDNKPFVSYARIVGAAAFVQSLTKPRGRPMRKEQKAAISSIIDSYWSPVDLSEALLKPALVGSFIEEFETNQGPQSDITSIVLFLLRCPPALKPSLNKAFYFIEQGGFIDADTPEEFENQKISASTLKTSWVKYAVAGPFLTASILLDLNLDELAPDAPSSVKIVRNLVQNTERMKEYFGLAKFIQNRMLSLLDNRSRSRFKFLKFPSSVVEVPTALHPLEDDQQDIVRRYRAAIPSY